MPLALTLADTSCLHLSSDQFYETSKSLSSICIQFATLSLMDKLRESATIWVIVHAFIYMPYSECLHTLASCWAFAIILYTQQLSFHPFWSLVWLFTFDIPRLLIRFIQAFRPCSEDPWPSCSHLWRFRALYYLPEACCYSSCFRSHRVRWRQYRFDFPLKFRHYRKVFWQKAFECYERFTKQQPEGQSSDWSSKTRKITAAKIGLAVAEISSGSISSSSTVHQTFTAFRQLLRSARYEKLHKWYLARFPLFDLWHRQGHFLCHRQRLFVPACSSILTLQFFFGRGGV